MTASLTDDQIREYVRYHWRDQWMDGGVGKGTVDDAATILFSTTTSHEGKERLRDQFRQLIAAQGESK